MLFLHLSKKSKPIKQGKQKNKSIKCSHVKKITSKSLRKNKTLIYSIPIQLTFHIIFFHRSIHDKNNNYIYIIQNIISITIDILIYVV
jgi:hypothetical protein